MIQELFGMMEERKLSSPAALLLNHCSVNSSSSSPSMYSPNSSTISEPQQNLRCPRCDSSNTKFCYYNNYNLTQPRHFCKTCRRYWTKGGALRNVPIGGGCRKVKPCRSAATKPKPTTPVIAGLGHELQSPAASLWNLPYSSQLLDLLKNSQFQNPNPNSSRKQDSSMFSTHLDADPAGAVYEEGLSFDSLGQHAMLPFNSLWRNGCAQYPYHEQPPPPQQHNVYMGEMQSTSGIHELLQRLKTSANYNYGSLSSSFNTCMTTSSTAATILEPLALSGDDIGNWNPDSISWFDLQTN